MVEKGTLELYIQLSPVKKRLLHYKARVEMASQALLRLPRQFVTVAPLVMANTSLSGIESLVGDITDDVLTEAIEVVNGKDLNDLMKTYGPNGDNLLMNLCCR